MTATKLDRDTIRNSVREALDNAVDNGHRMWEWDAVDVAEDLRRYSLVGEYASIAEMMPHIEQWIRERTIAPIAYRDAAE